MNGTPDLQPREENTIVAADVVDGNLVLRRYDGTTEIVSVGGSRSSSELLTTDVIGQTTAQVASVTDVALPQEGDVLLLVGQVKFESTGLGTSEVQIRISRINGEETEVVTPPTGYPTSGGQQITVNVLGLWPSDGSDTIDFTLEVTQSDAFADGVVSEASIKVV